MRPAVRGCWLAAVLLPLVLTGCSGTRFGDVLSRSFSGAPTSPAGGSLPSGTGVPPAGPSAPDAKAPASAIGSTKGTPAPVGQAPLDGKARATAAPKVTQASGSASAPATPVPARPAPYRVTILLPQADASAPAEVVTQALRAAGVPFEVETIERIGSGPSLSAPAGSVPSTQLAPTVRSAPAPR